LFPVLLLQCLNPLLPLSQRLAQHVNLDRILVVILLALMGINSCLTGNILDPFV
jgi:hypothetical protein